MNECSVALYIVGGESEFPDLDAKTLEIKCNLNLKEYYRV